MSELKTLRERLAERLISGGALEEIVVVSLMNYYELCAKPDKIDNTEGEYIGPDTDLLWAIERVLADFMTSKDFNDWKHTRTGGFHYREIDPEEWDGDAWRTE